MIQLIDHMKFNKKGVPNDNASIPLRREKKIITGGRGKEGPGSEREGEGKKQGQDQVLGETGE